MVHYKKLLLRIFFGMEIALFIGIYLGGSQGFSMLKMMKKENNLLIQEIVSVEGEVHLLEGECQKWERDTFYKERWARERLQMARSDDEVYFFVE